MSGKHTVVAKSGFALALVVLLLGGLAVYKVEQTSQQLSDLHAQARSIGGDSYPTKSESRELPAPVKRYFEFVFRGNERSVSYVELKMAGEFRRPLTETFEPTTARQTLVPNVPALVFEAYTPIFPGIYATVYDAYLDGEMEMKAKLLSLLTVVDEKSSVSLDRVSLRRWLLEASLYPQALRPSAYLKWESIDNLHARAVVNYKTISIDMVATFSEDDGRLVSLHAEQDGDLTTPYHGSGEFVSRSDYRDVEGVMIPFKFTVARMAKGKIFPFWKGEVTAYKAHYL
ncbi:MAG: hypothetical protein OQL27_06815 [Sedimenticola sp.]|nr:hypothetical protein [Sedimenticola sp.]